MEVRARLSWQLFVRYNRRPVLLCLWILSQRRLLHGRERRDRMDDDGLENEPCAVDQGDGKEVKQ